MSVYKISYAVAGETDRIKFVVESPHPLTQVEIVSLAAQHRKPTVRAAFSTLAPPHTRQLQMAANKQMMATAGIENVEYIVEGSTHIQCVPSR